MSCNCKNPEEWHPHSGVEWRRNYAGCKLTIWVHDEKWTWHVENPCGYSWKGNASDKDEAKKRAKKIASASESFDYLIDTLEGNCV